MVAGVGGASRPPSDVVLLGRVFVKVFDVIVKIVEQ